MNRQTMATNGSGILVIGALIWRLACELNEKRKLQASIGKLKSDQLKLIDEYLKVATTIPFDIKIQINDLATDYALSDPQVAAELREVVQLIDQEMEVKAIAALAKVIENLLKETYAASILASQYSNAEEFVEKKRRLVFAKLVDYAKTHKLLSDYEHALLNLLRELRNKASHELNVCIGKNWQTIAFLTGIEIIIKIKNTHQDQQKAAFYKERPYMVLENVERCRKVVIGW